MTEKMKGKLIYPITYKKYDKEGYVDKILYDIGTDVIIIGQTDAASTLNTGGIAFCCIMPDGKTKNIQDSHVQFCDYQSEENNEGMCDKLTKRELLSAFALCGYCSSAMPLEDKEIAEAARLSVKAADALLLKLAKMK